MSITTRQLHRRCLSSFGYSVSTLSRIVRFHRFWSIAELAAPGTPLAAVAHDAGYSDHAHLVRDCGRAFRRALELDQRFGRVPGD